MKVAIITYSKAYNYGALLQSYALEQAITEMGHECYQINYESKAVKRQYSIVLPHTILELKKDISLVLNIRRKIKLNRFQRNIKYTKKVCKNKLVSLNDAFDCFVTGSDQVWNKICTDGDLSYFLDFVKEPKKCNSYAASFGTDVLAETEQLLYPKYLTRFNHISVRETSGRKLIYDMTNKEVPVCLDPVFLLDSSQWIHFTRIINKRYILLFQYVSNIEVIKKAAHIAKEKKCELYIYSSAIGAYRYGKTINNIGVEEFLSYIINAELIITDSFHCTAFSIIFKKQFYSCLRNGDPANTRLDNVMKMFELDGRYFEDVKKNQTIDYTRVDEKLEILKCDSRNYLKRIFGGDI